MSDNQGKRLRKDIQELKDFLENESKDKGLQVSVQRTPKELIIEPEYVSCIKCVIRYNGKVYQISDGGDDINILVDGQLLIYPISANSIDVSYEQYTGYFGND